MQLRDFTKVTLYHETVDVPHWSNKVTVLSRWVVRKPGGELYGYSSTWFGGYRLLCQLMGWKVPT